MISAFPTSPFCLRKLSFPLMNHLLDGNSSKNFISIFPCIFFRVLIYDRIVYIYLSYSRGPYHSFKHSNTDDIRNRVTHGILQMQTCTILVLALHSNLMKKSYPH